MIGGIAMDLNKTENSSEALDKQLEKAIGAANGEEKESTVGNVAVPQENDTSIVPGKSTRILSVGEWMLVIFAMLIPIVNIVFMAVWAFSSDGNVHRRNFARAAMLWLIILLIACVVALSIAGFSGVNLLRNMITGQAG